MNQVASFPIITSLFFLLLLAVRVSACSCAEERPVYKEFSAAKDVVIMRALAAVSTAKDGIDGNEEVKVMKFAVEKVFKGGLKTGEKLNMSWTGMCDFGFYPEDVGEDFLFYYFGDMYFMVPPCTRSGRVKWRTADVDWIENRDKVRGMTRISGIVVQYFDSAIAGEKIETIPLKNHTVRIMGSGRDIRLKTNEYGVFEVYALPPGQYRVAPGALRGYMSTNSIRSRTDSVVLRIGTGGHAEADFHFEIDNTIRGKLVDDDGRPLSGVSLKLLPANGPPRKYFVETSTTDNAGNFEFTSIPAGNYTIVDNSPEMTTQNPYVIYFSGTNNEANKITIGPGDMLEGLVIRKQMTANGATIPAQRWRHLITGFKVYGLKR